MSDQQLPQWRRDLEHLLAGRYAGDKQDVLGRKLGWHRCRGGTESTILNIRSGLLRDTSLKNQRILRELAAKHGGDPTDGATT